MRKFTFLDEYLNIDYYENFLPDNEANSLYNILKNIDWPDDKKRHSKSYGNKGLIYKIDLPDYKNPGKRMKISRPAIEWNEFPLLNDIKDRIKELYNDNINMCVIQYYANGKIFIPPHKDKEMLLGTSIYGLSLGATRKLTMLRNQIPFYLPLENNSLYILRPPTNSFWAHCIPKEVKITEPRFSLTFRNYLESK